VLSSDLKIPTGKIKGKIPQIMIVGIPGEYCDQIEEWVGAQQGTLVVIREAFLIVNYSV
jgi:hypothetical protein